MSSSSGNSSGSGCITLIQNSGSDGDLQVLMDQRKRKRMQSNRESARRSRMRKQKHLDDLMAELARLKKENEQILTSTNITTLNYLEFEAENSVLRAQMGELRQRLQSLNDIVDCINNNDNAMFDKSEDIHIEPDRSFMNNNNNPWNLMYVNQPIMASPAEFYHQY